MDRTADPMISLEHVNKIYPDGTEAVRDLSIAIGQGELCALVGPSGCGKTTSMRMVNRLDEPTSGRVLVGGIDVSQTPPEELRRHIGYVIQAVGLFPHYTVQRNVGTVCALLGWDRDRTAARADELLAMVDLDPELYGDHYPHQLSGGQRQRVGVARALAADPPVLLMDEPFGAVDPIARDHLQELLLDLQRRVRKTIVLVTHDIDEAVRLADRIAVLSQGGVLEQYAPPAEVLASPANDFVADFVGVDRTLKLLRVSDLPADAGTEVTGGLDLDNLPELPASPTLQQTLTALLDSPDGRAVLPESGGPRVVSFVDVHRALRGAAA